MKLEAAKSDVSWKELAIQASVETNPEELLLIVEALNAALAKRYSNDSNVCRITCKRARPTASRLQRALE